MTTQDKEKQARRIEKFDALNNKADTIKGDLAELLKLHQHHNEGVHCVVIIQRNGSPDVKVLSKVLTDSLLRKIIEDALNAELIRVNEELIVL